MLRQPSQSSTVSGRRWRDLRVDQRHQRHAHRRPRRPLLVVIVIGIDGAKPATNSRTLSCTCGAARPTPWYSRIVSNMSSMSCWMRGRLISAGSSALGARAQDRMAHARDLQNRHAGIIVVSHAASGYRFCPRCGGPLETRSLKAGDPERLVCAACGFVLLPGSEGRGRHDHHARRFAARARAAGDRAGLRAVGVPRRVRRSRRGARRRGTAGGPRGVGTRGPLDGLVNIYSYPGRAPIIVVYAATALGGELCGDDECLEAAAVHAGADPMGRARIPQHHRGAARLPQRIAGTGPRHADASNRVL